MDRESLSAGAREEIKQLFRERSEAWIAGSPDAFEDPVELELLTVEALLLYQDAAAPEGVAEDAVAVLEERADPEGAALLATAAALLAPSVSEPARAALERLRERGVEPELPDGTGELGVAAVRRFDGDRGEIYVASLLRSGEDAGQEALVAIEGNGAGSLLVSGGLARVGGEAGPSLMEDAGGLVVEPRPTNVSADELHAAIAEALATAAEPALPVPHELGLALPILWRAAGGDAAALEGLHLALPGEEPGPLDEFFDDAAEERALPPSRALPHLKLDAPRNSPCPCGSGRKSKRCCLPRIEGLRREAGQLEDLAAELAERALAQCRLCLEAAFGELFHSTDWWGFEEAQADQRLDAALWIVCDGQLCEGLPAPIARSPVDGGPDPDQRAWAEALAGSRMRAWRVEAVGEAGLLEAVCPLSGEAAELELVRAPMGELEAGSLLVARSLPRAEGRFALLGTVPVVAPEAQEDFERLLERVRADAESPDEAWRLRGGELLRAAWCWPEERSHTCEGEQVVEHHVVFALRDPDRAVRVLTDDPEVESGGISDDEVMSWAWRPPGEPKNRAAMPREPGVRWQLCDEDSADSPWLAMLELCPQDGELWVFAPSEARLQLAEERLVERFGPLLGDELHRDRDVPEVVYRWQRERLSAAAA